MAALPRHAGNDGVDRARRRRMRSVAVGVGVTVVVAAVLVDRETEPDYAAVCVDPDTQERVDDDQCRTEHHSGVGTAFAWYYLGRASRVPAIGSAVAGGTYDGTHLSGQVQRGGLPAKGGSTVHSSTVRGGFGGSSHGFGS
jgi:hypothetical protein